MGSLPLIALLRRLIQFAKKDQRLLANYHRSHPHFYRYLAIDALLSVALVGAGFQLYRANSPSSEIMPHAGLEVMSSGQLIDHLKKDGISAYWIGPIRGDEYTVDHEEAGIVDVMYLPKGTEPSKVDPFVYEVKTYGSQKIWDAHTHTILATTGTQVLILSSNLTIRINPSSMKGVIATFVDKPEIVAIAYPKRQSLNDMVKNVESLKLIR